MKFSEETLKDALSRGDIKVYLQFCVDISEVRIRGAEALSRWKHPEYGFMKPEKYIGPLETEGIIIHLDLFCLDKVCTILESWEQKGWRDLKLSCNISRADFMHPFLYERITEIIGKYNFKRENLILEVTENAVGDSNYYIERILIKLKEYGVRIALDDLGGGPVSFRDLQLFPLDYIKLDKSLLKYSNSEKGLQVLQDVTRLGRNLNCKVVLEGVETDYELNMARQSGVDAVQGFHFYVPMPIVKAEQILVQYFQKTDKG